MPSAEVVIVQSVDSDSHSAETVRTACQVLDSFYQLAQRERVLLSFAWLCHDVASALLGGSSDTPRRQSLRGEEG